MCGRFGARLDLLQPLPSELVNAYEVSTSVNAPENDSPECIKPLPPGYVPRGLKGETMNQRFAV